MMTKQDINELKKERNGVLGDLVQSQNDREIVYILENLGYLPKDFDGSWLPNLLEHQNKHVRFWATKTIGKLRDPAFIPYLEKTVCKTMLRTLDGKRFRLLEDNVLKIQKKFYSKYWMIPIQK